MKTTGVSSIPKFGLLGFLGHPSPHTRIACEDDLKKDKAGRKWTTKPNLNKYVPQRLLIFQQQISTKHNPFFNFQNQSIAKNVRGRNIPIFVTASAIPIPLGSR